MPPLNPLLESDSIECLHKGKVLLQSSTKDLMCVQDSNGTDAGVISLNDLANATIIGCTNNIAGIPNPCTKLANIPNSICSTLLEIDNQKIVLAQAISQVLTDKGSPLILQGEPKAKYILELDEDITEFSNAQNTNDSEKSISESSPKSSETLNTKSSVESNKDSNNSQTSTSEDKKSEIDLRGQTTPNGGKVEWISQFDTRKEGMGTNAGNSACCDTCKEILKRAGISSVEGGFATYQVALEKDIEYNKKTKIYQQNATIKIVSRTDHNEYMQPNPQKFQEGLAYLDSELEKGYPVLIGVNHTYESGVKNFDKSSDHFVVIVGRGYDEQGLFYRYYEVGTGKWAFFDETKSSKNNLVKLPSINAKRLVKNKKDGTRDENKLHIKNNQSLEGTSFLKNKDKTNKHYFVTQIRKNLSYK